MGTWRGRDFLVGGHPHPPPLLHVRRRRRCWLHSLRLLLLLVPSVEKRGERDSKNDPKNPFHFISYSANERVLLSLLDQTVTSSFETRPSPTRPPSGRKRVGGLPATC